MASTEVLLALSTFPDLEVARSITHTLIEEQLAACGNILPRVDSMYRWRGKIESSSEVLVFYKVAAARYAQFEAKLKSLHPYDVPEIVAFGVKEGSPDYLRWVAESCLNG